MGRECVHGFSSSEILYSLVSFNGLTAKSRIITPQFLQYWTEVEGNWDRDLILELQTHTQEIQLEIAQLLTKWAQREIRERSKGNLKGNSYVNKPSYSFLSDALICFSRQDDSQGKKIGTKRRAAHLLVCRAKEAIEADQIRDRTQTVYERMIDEQQFAS